VDAARDAASVAGDLLAFYREPARFRPPYLHREVPMPDGQAVFRLALGRLPHGWLRDLPQHERDEVREAAVAFVRQVCLWERATHYQVLCLDPDATPAAIKENYHLLIALIHPDRQDTARAWPTGCSQRANEAHETLGDAARRKRYDDGLAHAGQAAPLETMARVATGHEHAHAGRVRYADRSPASLWRRFAVVGGVIAALFIVQAWWVGGVSPQHSLLERSIPASARWMRNALPDAPRFLTAAAASAPASFDTEPLPMIKEPRRVASLGNWIPMAEPPRGTAAVAMAPPPMEARPGRIESAAGDRATASSSASAVAVEAPPPATRAPVVVAQASAPATRVAQASPPVPGAPTREQVEALVALMVGFYDSGDADKLVGLFDPDRLGWWAGVRTRSSYADFFAATRARRLQMERFSWQSNGTSAQARGEATVTADYADGRPRLERRIPIEVDIGLRDGQARITRLVLYPGGP
jgi:hypothetical protein